MLVFPRENSTSIPRRGTSTRVGCSTAFPSPPVQLLSFDLNWKESVTSGVVCVVSQQAPVLCS